MSQQQQQQQKPETFNQAQALGLTYLISGGLAQWTLPFLCTRYGKKALRRVALWSGGLQLAWIMFHPRHETVLTRFLVIWMLAVILQNLMAFYSHNFGIRQQTRYVGKPIVSFLVGEHLGRRLANPLITLGISQLITNPALAGLFKLSALGQVVYCLISYSIQAAEDDQRGDMEADMHLNMGRR